MNTKNADGIFQVAYVEFTNHCNYECIFCQNSTIPKKFIRLADFKDFETIISRTNIIDITGYGEIMLHPDFNEIIKIITKYNKQFSLSTNGSVLTKEKIDILNNSSLYLLNISLNSLNFNVYKKLSGGKGNLYTVGENIINLLNSKPKFKIKFSFVITNLNFKEIFNFINFAYKYGKSQISFYDLVPNLKYPEGLKVEDTPKNRQFLKDAISHAKNLKLIIDSFDFDMNTEKKEVKLQDCLEACHPPFSSIFIGADGNVVPCCWNSTSMGNITQQSVDEIWLGEKYNELRTAIHTGNTEFCKNCRLLG
jgi:MoaA/NifB/PqqE/SkfB family radical SAM enzyme